MAGVCVADVSYVGFSSLPGAGIFLGDPCLATKTLHVIIQVLRRRRDAGPSVLPLIAISRPPLNRKAKHSPKKRVGFLKSLSQSDQRLGHQRGMGGRAGRAVTVIKERHTDKLSLTPNHKTRHSANEAAATHPERTSLVTRGRTPSGTRRWALRAASPARHTDAQGARANDRRHAKTGLVKFFRGRQRHSAYAKEFYITQKLGYTTPSMLGQGA